MRNGDEFIIEHPRRGTFREFMWELNDDHSGGYHKPRFSSTGSRNDPEKTKIFSSFVEAATALAKFPTPLRWECSILVFNPIKVAYHKIDMESNG